MQQAYRVHGQVAEDGSLTVENIPFAAGQEVEVIVLAEARKARDQKRYPLHGTVIQYINPTDPIAADDWDALK